MKAATVYQLKQELQHRSEKELIELCLRLSKFKKENKELLTYLLFESDDEAGFITNVKAWMDTAFEDVNIIRTYFVKKGIRKILRETKKYIRYTQNKETEVELLLYFCFKMKDFKPSLFRNQVLRNLYDRQIEAIEKKIAKLHEDLQYDYTVEIENLKR